MSIQVSCLDEFNYNRVDYAYVYTHDRTDRYEDRCIYIEGCVWRMAGLQKLVFTWAKLGDTLCLSEGNRKERKESN